MLLFRMHCDFCCGSILTKRRYLWMVNSCEFLATHIEKNTPNCKINWHSIFAGTVSGTIDEQTFNIMFNKEVYLLITDESGGEVIEKLRPLLTGFMGCSPCCRYEIVSCRKKISAMEWNVIDPIARIVELSKIDPFDDDKVVDLRLVEVN